MISRNDLLNMILTEAVESGVTGRVDDSFACHDYGRVPNPSYDDGVPVVIEGESSAGSGRSEVIDYKTELVVMPDGTHKWVR